MRSRLLTVVDMVAVIGELIGTTLFLFFGYAGIEVATLEGRASPDLQVLLYISATFGASLMVNAWIFFRISGGLFNPAVSIMETSRKSRLTLIGNISTCTTSSSSTSPRYSPCNYTTGCFMLSRHPR